MLVTKAPLLAVAGWGAALVILIIASLPERETPTTPVLQPQVLETKDDRTPAEFPKDLPLEKNEPGFELTQSTGNLDYLQKTASYLVVFLTPWSKDKAADAYAEYLDDEGFTVERQNVGENSVFLNGSKEGKSMSVNVTEEKLTGAPEGTPPYIRVSISYAKR